MISDSNRVQQLMGLEFDGYSKTIKRILETYGIVSSTIDKIVSKVNEGEQGPFYVYRRAAILCSDIDEGRRAQSLIESVPLVITLTPTSIHLLSRREGEAVCEYGQLYQYEQYISPLENWDINKNDPYSTHDLATLVNSLYRELILNNNSHQNALRFIFSLLYISHFSSILELNRVRDILKKYEIDERQKLSSIFNYFLNADCPFVSDGMSLIVLSKEAYKYIFAIIRFDTTLIDAEVLTSLVYGFTEKENAGIYGHKTSSINVEKMLQALFLSEMQARAINSTNENVFQIVNEVYETTIFDPTTGPGCFLVASYNGLTQQLRDVETRFNIICDRPLSLKKFVGLVENELAKRLTELSLIFTHTKELKRLGLLCSLEDINQLAEQLAIYIGKELKDNWEDYVVPNEFLYIVGSPNFKGYNKASDLQKSLMKDIFCSENLNNSDYSSTWLIKAAKLIKGTKASVAFVLTNSITQGNQASFVLESVNKAGCEYIFGYTSFKWKTSDKDNVGVTVVIIGIAQVGVKAIKYLYDGLHKISCKSIGSNLLPDIDIRIVKRRTPISKVLPPMRKGNMPEKAIPLTFTSEQLDEFLAEYPESAKFIRPLYGGQEFVDSCPKWCLWISDAELAEAKNIKGIADRIEQVRIERCKDGSTSSQKAKANPHKFRETFCTTKGKFSVVVPCVTSENREYFQMGILDSKAIMNNNINVIYDSELWVLALLESKMHLVWAKTAAGGHENRPRYSSELCYNTFPAPELDKKRMGTLNNLSKTLIEVREKYCDKALGTLYNELPPELARVHKLIDMTIDSFYRNKPFENNKERLLWLKNLYNKLIADEQRI